MKLGDLTRRLDRIEHSLGRKRCKLCGARCVHDFAELALLAEDGPEDLVLCACERCACEGSSLARLARAAT